MKKFFFLIFILSFNIYAESCFYVLVEEKQWQCICEPTRILPIPEDMKCEESEMYKKGVFISTFILEDARNYTSAKWGGTKALIQYRKENWSATYEKYMLESAKIMCDRCKTGNYTNAAFGAPQKICMMLEEKCSGILSGTMQGESLKEFLINLK